MDGLFILLLGCLGLLPSFSEGQSVTQSVVIKNLDNKKGRVYIGWYTSEKDFTDGNNATFKKIVPVQDKQEIAVNFDQVNPGVYAIAVFFDENGNGELDKNFLGIPKEVYGFSNNIIPLTRSATFKEASFIVGASAETIVIKVK
jgi:uncharacterized protein (DUF2141 family)